MLARMRSGETGTEEGEDRGIDAIYEKLVHPSSSFRAHLPCGLYLEKRYDEVLLGRGTSSPTPPFEVDLVVPGCTPVPGIGKDVVAEEMARGDLAGSIETTPEAALLDYDRLRFPLKVRNFRPGDRFQPLGVQGTQKVKEFFIDHKVPAFERPNIPFVVSAEGIAWIAGYRIDDRFKITDQTQKILKVQLVSQDIE
jgi:tRNA(Ile)-lysidine synthase